MSEQDELEVYLTQAMRSPEFRAAWERVDWHDVRLLTPLPRRVRFRLWWQHRVNGLGIWLCEHERTPVAVGLWRIFRMWP